MKLCFFLVLGILAVSADFSEPESKDIDFSKVKVNPNNIIMQPQVLASSENKTVPSRKFSPRIVNGKLATSMKKFSYQVKLYLQSPKDYDFYSCGASIIGRKWLLTAAHCLKDFIGGYVYVGCVDLLDLTGSCKKISVSPSDYIWHKSFLSTPEDTQNDIGLIRLRTPLIYSENVTNIALHTNPYVKANTTVVLSGYGITESGVVSNRLRYTSVKIIDEPTCKMVFDTVNSNMICFGASSITSDCQGDSGGPMCMRDNGKTTLVGVTSFGGPTCLNYPGVYTRVSAYLKWICQNTSGDVCYGQHNNTSRWRGNN